MKRPVQQCSPRVGWVQRSSLGSVDGNQAACLGNIEALARDGAELIFLPELALWDYFAISERADAFDQAVEVSGPEVGTFRQLAKSLKVVIFLPIFERRARGLYHNTTVVIGDQGEILDVYRKMHIPDDPGFYEKYYFSPGDLGWKVVEAKGLKVGLLICWDQWFPEAARLTAMAGAELIYYPTAIGWDRAESSEICHEQLEAWRTIIRSHSIANGLFTLAVNRVGSEGHLDFWGNSLLVAPSGRTLVLDDQDEACHTQELDLGRIEYQRRAWPFFRDRRIDAYGGLLKRWGDT